MSTTTERALRTRLRILPAGSTWRSPLAIVGMAIATAWIVIAIAAPLLAPHHPLGQDFTPQKGPSWQHLFGTDELGRDVLSRVMFGARLSLPVALLLVGLALVIGGTLGAIAGYFGGFIDGLIMRATDLVFAFPAIILAMVVTAALGPSLVNAVFALVIVSWPSYARVVRGLVRSLKDADYV
jgi:ABC-type dipeptide/oligopeptide/nickel transport system permease subunit